MAEQPPVFHVHGEDGVLVIVATGVVGITRAVDGRVFRGQRQSGDLGLEEFSRDLAGDRGRLAPGCRRQGVGEGDDRAALFRQAQQVARPAIEAAAVGDGGEAFELGHDQAEAVIHAVDVGREFLRRRHGFECRLLEDFPAEERFVPEEEIAERGVERARATGPGHVPIECGQGFSFHDGVALGHARGWVGVFINTAVVHAERAEERVLEVVGEGLAGDLGDDFTEQEIAGIVIVEAFSRREIRWIGAEGCEVRGG